MNLFEIVKKAELRAIERPADWYNNHCRAIMLAMPPDVTFAWLRISYKGKLKAIVPGAFNSFAFAPYLDNDCIIKSGNGAAFEYNIRE